jgi:hypothetical protein
VDIIITTIIHPALLRRILLTQLPGRQAQQGALRPQTGKQA